MLIFSKNIENYIKSRIIPSIVPDTSRYSIISGLDPSVTYLTIVNIWNPIIDTIEDYLAQDFSKMVLVKVNMSSKQVILTYCLLVNYPLIINVYWCTGYPDIIPHIKANSLSDQILFLINQYLDYYRQELLTYPLAKIHITSIIIGFMHLGISKTEICALKIPSLNDLSIDYRMYRWYMRLKKCRSKFIM